MFDILILTVQDEYIYLLHNHPGSVLLETWKGGQQSSPLLSKSPLVGITIMTKKQIRDLQQFAVELAKEGNTEAAKEVLALITNHG